MTSKTIGRLFVFQVAANILVLCFIIAQLVIQAGRLQDIQAAQLHYVRDQNTLSLCAQREVLVAVKGIGRKLGLPVDDIVAPPIDPETCLALAHEIQLPPPSLQEPP